MNDFVIEKYSFEPWSRSERRKLRECAPIPALEASLLGTNWPVVYILYTDRDDTTDKVLYVGETTSATQRMGDHLKNTQRGIFNAVRIIFDKRFNKSAILDVEQSLINLFFADKKYTLQNRNEGQSDSHDYYDRAYYQGKVREIWNNLKNHSDIEIEKDYNEIINSKLFKFSPHTVLTEEQNDVCMNILENAFNVLDDWTVDSHPYIAQINGQAGTGKTIVLMHLFGMLEETKQMSQGKNSGKDKIAEFNRLINRIANYKQTRELNFAYVCSCDSLHATMREVVRETYGRRSPGHGKVCKPAEIGNAIPDHFYDIVLIDESHRLFGQCVGMGTKAYINMNYKLFGCQEDESGRYTQMDWILKKSKCVIMVYDENQVVRKHDMTPLDFQNAFSRVQPMLESFPLLGQMRCNGGALFMDFLSQMLSGQPNVEEFKCPDVGSFDIQLFDDAPSLIDAIAIKNEEYGLCRTVCGPGEQYRKGKYSDAINAFKAENELSDSDIFNNIQKRRELQEYLLEYLIDADGVLNFPDGEGNSHRYIRNLSDWVLKGDPYEIGCIHTVQGYDLNYVGVIFSDEIHYDAEARRVYIDKRAINDRNSIPNSLDDSVIESFVLNTYKVLLSRGVQGCYLHAVNKDMQEYLSSLGLFRESK